MVGGNQDPEALTDRVLRALLNNASFLLATRMQAQAAAELAKQMGQLIAGSVLTRMGLYRFAAWARLRPGREPSVFRLRSIPLREFWGPERHPERVPELEATVTRLTRRRLPEQVAAELATLEERILEHHLRVRGVSVERVRPAVPAEPGVQRTEQAGQSGVGTVVLKRPALARPDTEEETG
jgi:hypothetical protein